MTSYLERQRHLAYVAERKRRDFDEWKWVRISLLFLGVYVPLVLTLKQVGVL